VAAALLAFLSATRAFAQEAPPSPSPSPSPEAAAAPEETPPRLLIKGFGNVDFRAEFDGHSSSSFALGEMDLFITSELADNLSFLTEVVFEPKVGEEKLDIERYQIEYSFSDLLNVSLGRMHTMLGHWNQAYHHGVWFQMTAFRPEIYLFEDEGGVLPVHELGLRVSGSRATSVARLEYSLSVANGRGPVVDRFENFRDYDRSKAVNLWLAAGLRRPAGLKVGGVFHTDTIPPDPLDPARRPAPLSERIVGGFVSYQRGRTEVLGEVLRVTHEEDGSGRRFRTSGFYLQASHRRGRFTPYYRFEGIDRGAGDPYYPSSDDLRRHVGGLRVDPWPWAALKLELSHDAPDPGADFSAATLQAAFTF
jgi:hypothetical protein